jgi:hypothetical protein
MRALMGSVCAMGISVATDIDLEDSTLI